MTPCARRAADLTTINAFTKLHHFTRRALRNGKSAGCDLTGVRMRALRGLGGLLDNIPGKCRRTGTSSDTRGTGVGAPTIDNPVDAPAYVVRDIERSIRSHRQAGGTMHGFGRRLHCSREAIGKDLALARCVIRSEEHTSELQSRGHLVCRLLLEK